VRPLLDNLRAEINSTERESAGLIFEELWAHFQVFELRDPEVDRSPTTISLYLENFQRYILPRWGQTHLPQMKPVVIEKWLRSLRYAPSTKAKLRNQMSAVFLSCHSP
jgi:integrase